jgi:hypothetical protein
MSSSQSVAVIARLDWATQYSATVIFFRDALEYWIPGQAGDDD